MSRYHRADFLSTITTGKKPESCKACVLYEEGAGFVPAHGPGSNGILLVGEAPGQEEAVQGFPFIGAAGAYLNRVLKRAGQDRAQFKVDNVLHCQPPNNWLIGAPWQTESLARCAHFLATTIATMKPKVIVALGNTALEALTGFTGIHRYRGRVIAHNSGSWVVPTYHPSYLLPRKGQVNTSRYVGAVMRDLRLAHQISRDGFVRLPRIYQEDPQPDEFAMFILEYEQAPERYLSVDIETALKLKRKDEDDLDDDEEEQEEGLELPTHEPILRIGFSFQVGHAVSVPFQGPWLEGIKRLLASAGPKVVWNGSRFDIPVLKAHGFDVGGTIYDFMWGWHVLQSDLPKGLEYVASFYSDVLPWKHEAEAQPAWYNAVDADVALEIALGVERELKAAHQWDIFQRHVVDLDPLLLEIGAKGVHIDRARQTALKLQLQGEEVRLTEAAQREVPEDILPRKRFKKKPSSEVLNIVPIEIAGKAKFCTHCDAQVSNKSEHQKGKANPCKQAKATLEVRPAPVTEWDELLPFNPNSVKDLTKYALAFKHPLGVNPKTRRPTMDKKHVAKLAKQHGTKHPIYQIALDLRAIKKTLGTYVIGFAPDASGKIYTTYGHHPSTLRLSARNKNLMNVSHRGNIAYAEDVRRTIIPAPGCVFVEADSSAIEAVLTGHFMGSPDFIDLARKGVHAFLTCFELDWEFTPANVAKVKADHGVAYARNKQVVYLTLYGGTPPMMTALYPEFFPDIPSAHKAQQRFFDACPGLAKWQNDTRLFAYRQGYLVNPWNYRHWFFDVYAKTKDGGLVPGTDANRVVAFLPQSSAAAFMKDNVALLKQTPFWPLPANGLVHDSYCLEVASTRIEEAVEMLTGILTRPIPELNGLTIGCEIKVGQNWADLKAA